MPPRRPLPERRADEGAADPARPATMSTPISLSDVIRVLSLADYNTRVVVTGTMLLGVAAGVIGTFMLLRKRALMGDAISHATLPGIGVAFLIMTAFGGTGRWLPGLLAGAVVAGLLGMGGVLLIRMQSRLKEDAALAIVLSVFFGLGIAILGIVQQQTQGHAAGLESFIYGKTASMLGRDAWLIAGAAGIVVLLCLLLFKEFALLCFDAEYARTLGWPVGALDVAMMALVVLVTVIGLQAVGLILMIALLTIPPAAARFWTHHLPHMLWISALIGGVSCLIGSALSALLPRLPAGAIIVVTASGLFMVSLVFGGAQGVLRRAVERVRVTGRVRRQNLLRDIYEWHESHQPATTVTAPASEPVQAMEPVALDQLCTASRTWNARELRSAVRSTLRHGLLVRADTGRVRLTAEGETAARRVVRNHRLWELYMMTHADIAPSHVDDGADAVEHILGPVLTEQLEAQAGAGLPSPAPRGPLP